MATRPHGAWRSPLSAQHLSQAVRGLTETRLHGGRLYWIERRPDEGGRQAVVSAGPGGDLDEALPADANVRSRVHEYGGGSFEVCDRGLFTVDEGEPGIGWRTDGGRVLVPGSNRPVRYAEPVASPDGRWLVAVEEEPRAVGEPANRLVAFELAGGGRRVLAEGGDFYASPTFAPDGGRLAYLTWDHPAMPWDTTTLVEADFREGALQAPRIRAGGPGESVFQPAYGPDGALVFAADRSGFWNLYRGDGSGSSASPLCPRDAEFGRPQWVFGMRSHAFAGPGRLVCTRIEDGHDRLGLLDLESGRLEDLAPGFVSVTDVVCDGTHVAFVGGRTDEPSGVRRLDLGSGRIETLRLAADLEWGPELFSPAEPVTFPSRDGRTAHAFLYRPQLPGHEGPAGEKPPLLVKAHGGPTAAASPTLDLGIQFWTTRGFAVLDVNYAGSTGYGRAYRRALDGAWGVADVDDCVAGALHACELGVADRHRLAISGGSAGGYTVLCALTFRDAFAVGASRYGIGDLEALARDTHKFESRYLDGLVGAWPEDKARYVERSPIHHTAGLSCPVIFFQGGEDRVVPPAQAEAMVAALAERGLLHAYVLYPDEGHGFRRAANIQRSLEGELYFYGRVLGFDPGVDPGIELSGAASSSAS